MRITEIAVFAYELTVAAGAYRISHGSITSLNSILVKITSDTGLTGWGEACPLGTVYQPQHAAGARAAIEEMAPGLIGTDPTKLGLLHRRMDALLAGHNYAKAALDIAAHDLTGKHFGLRVADLIGGAITERVPSYFAMGAASPEETADHAAQLVDAEYQRLQMKVGGRRLDEDIAAIRAVWDRVGRQARLAVDPNRGLTGLAALQLSSQCRDIPLILEQPCNTMAENLAIKQRLHHPLFLDESTAHLSIILDAVSQHLCDGFGMKLTRVGGIRPMTQVRDMCEIRSMPHTTDDGWGGDIIAAAGVHVAATVRPELNEGAWIAQPLLDIHYDPVNPIRVVDGHIQLPSGPGLGVVPDEDIIGDPLVVFD